ncbi:probable DNA polymerase [Pecten maximus]|uniref:probable DNA polymerase n=1 Tax=Pecten maximus TaxID=6579 RepID=UPI0014591570|nr:probable DNA polymerase [Pecten maximus]
MADLHMRTLDKQRYLQNLGYEYRCIWECDFERQSKVDELLKSFLKTLDVEDPLEPRDAFYGGRTEAFTMYAEASKNRQIKYYDVTSLYPYINKVGKVPLGHPTIITENFQNIEEYEGLIKCKMIPPRNLFIPVLPYRSNGKLLFPLCRTCAEDSSTAKCCHGDQKRAITGTWVTDELKTAIRKGYRLLETYEVWHFESISQYDTVLKTGGVFTEYVNTFLKLKQEASGWPNWCKTDHDKVKYINDFYDREGILLDREKIEENPGLRRLAKLMLNSFWGKFGQRTSMIQSSYISDQCEYFDMMSSDSQIVKDVNFVSDEMVRMDWNYDSDFLTASGRTNVVVAAYTTAQARLKLYSYLEPLDRSALYCDTDSVVFTVEPGQWKPNLGDNLGDLTDEVEGTSIVNFVTGGPKNYAYTLSKPNKDGEMSCCKVRGITLNYKNSLEINYDTVKDMVCGKKKKVTVCDELKTCRDKQSCNLLTTLENKDYQIVFDKRVMSNKYVTLPYGM